jgi:hypothetical protein
MFNIYISYSHIFYTLTHGLDAYQSQSDLILIVTHYHVLNSRF